MFLEIIGWGFLGGFDTVWLVLLMSVIPAATTWYDCYCIMPLPQAISIVTSYCHHHEPLSSSNICTPHKASLVYFYIIPKSYPLLYSIFPVCFSFLPTSSFPSSSSFFSSFSFIFSSYCCCCSRCCCSAAKTTATQNVLSLLSFPPSPSFLSSPQMNNLLYTL